MLRALVQVLLNGLGVVLAARLIPGIDYQGDLLYLILVGVVIGLLNLFVKPLAVLFSLPLIVLTLGLFYLAMNGLMLYLAAGLLDGLRVAGCGPAFLGGLVLGLVNWLARAFVDD